jgi:hypothetical protein
MVPGLDHEVQRPVIERDQHVGRDAEEIEGVRVGHVCSGFEAREARPIGPRGL